MTSFETNGFVFVKGFIDTQSIETISRYMEFSLYQDKFDDDDPTSRYSKYADPLIETVLQNSLSHVEEITEKALHPTYSYSRVYVQGDELEPHVDRPACEVSVTVNVATKGSLWPIWMKAPGKEPISFVLEPGDAVVYKGCEVTHWREKAVDTEINVQFMMHYVDQQGPCAAFKWDTRPSLGFGTEFKGV
jgi:hypothetical protein